MKEAVTKVGSGLKWMILIDEIFKGTNVVDAMRCSIDVIDGFCKVNRSLFVISTHLYEIVPRLQYPHKVSCYYMETIVDGDHFRFTYQLKEGVSNERIGYSLVKREGVTELLRQLWGSAQQTHL